MSAHRCPTCDLAGGDRYCAPQRCYCGHKDCPAFASWVDLGRVRVSVDEQAETHVSVGE